MNTSATASFSDFNFDSSRSFVRSLSTMSVSSDLGRHGGWQRAMTPTGSVADQIMDRIDKHIGGISTDIRFGSTFVKPVSGLDSFALSTLPGASTLKANDNANDDAASTSTVRLLRNFNPADVKNIDLDSDLGTETGDAVHTAPSKAALKVLSST